MITHERPKVLIDQSEYDYLLETKAKFHDLITSEKYIHHEYVCGAGWGCVDYDNYYCISKDEFNLKLMDKIKVLLKSYHTMPLWRRIIHSNLPGAPYDIKGMNEGDIKKYR